jgi:hypothetical protein
VCCLSCKPPFLRNKYKTKREFESAINLVNNRPFKYEIRKIPEQSLDGVETTRTEEYVSGFEQKTKKDLKAVGDFGLKKVGNMRLVITQSKSLQLYK